MKSYSIIFILVGLVIINNVSNIQGSPFGLLKTLTGSTQNAQNAQNAITQGERNRSLEFVKTVLVTPLYGPGITYKFGLLSRLFRQFSQISQNRPAQAGVIGAPNSISKTLHFNRGITVTNPTKSEGVSVTHATLSTTESAAADDKEESKPDAKEVDVDKDSEKEDDTEKDTEKDADKDGSDKDAEKDSEKDEEKDSDKDEEKESQKDSDKESEKDGDKESEKDGDKESEKDADTDSEKDADKESEKDGDKESEKDGDKDDADKTEEGDGDKGDDGDKDAEKDNDSNKDTDKEVDLALGSNDQATIALIHNPTVANRTATSSFSVSSTNSRTNIGVSKKGTNGGNSIKVTAASINSLQASNGKNLTGSGGYHYAPQGYRYTRNGPRIIFQPSEVINTLAG